MFKYLIYFVEKIIPDLGSGVIRTDNTLGVYPDHVQHFLSSVHRAPKHLSLSKQKPDI